MTNEGQRDARADKWREMAMDNLYAYVEARDIAIEAMREGLAACEALRAENERLRRACAEGLPRERLNCPQCGMLHIDGADASGYGTRPHHTHLCQSENGGCGHVFDTDRWSFGADVADDASELDSATALIAKQAAILTGVANALRGDPPPLTTWSHHDLAEMAAWVVAELEARRDSRAVNDALFIAASADVDSIGRRVARLEAREENRAGRTVPPTDEEVAAHAATGGSWRCIVTISGVIERGMCFDLNRTPPRSALAGSPRRFGETYVETWWALDARGFVCAWPVVTP